MKLRHLRSWLAVLREERRSFSLLKAIRALRSGRVDPVVWRRRMEVCRRCKIFDRELMRCRGPRVNGVELGCGCYVPVLALTKAPYSGPGGIGCWGRAALGERFGWGE